ncbi:Nucleoporin Nup37 [Orchesella cincta]|uniref:Nucleoporin Nup37 n=1 Tax=Orchesella cincta TaxID=48709 RepID=A0A1D2N506_ORCCI|nr:Nucleoporin Nup37 [Orchesella cincta]
MPSKDIQMQSPSGPSSYYQHQDPNMSQMVRGRLGHAPSMMPGGGGFYSSADMSSPSPFQMSSMSMVDSSTPTTTGGMPRGLLKDLNNYLPVHKIKLDGDPRRLYTVENNVTRETIVVLTCTNKISLFIMKIKDDVDPSNRAERFEFMKFHELSLQPHDLEGFTISQNCSITLIPFNLTYALSTRGGKVVYVYDQGNSNEVPTALSLEEQSESLPFAVAGSYIVQIPHDYPVTHLAIDAEKGHLACIQELGTVIVWDISSQMKMAVFHIPHQGIHISFHRSEPYQLMIIDCKGWARFFNIFRQCCFRSINLVQTTVFSADWSLSNSNIFAAGFAESFTVIDSSKVLTSMNKCYEVPEMIINAIRINPLDDKVFATLSRLTGTIQLWRDHFKTHIWKHRNAYVNDIAWIHGYPYLLALGHQTLYIYEASIS